MVSEIFNEFIVVEFNDDGKSTLASLRVAGLRLTSNDEQPDAAAASIVLYL